jgi:K+-transporting ATPase ATPase C chain
MMREQIKPAILVFIVLSLLTGICYPLLVTGIAQVFLKNQANGSLMYRDGKPIASTLIGQAFDEPKYFWGRLSATPSFAFNAASSSGSNIGPSNPALLDEVKTRIEALRAVDPGNTASIPVDLVTSSASGLDPHISLAAAYYQAPRVARVRGISQDTVRIIIQQCSSERFLWLLGEPVVNVVELNLALDEYKSNGLKVK